MGKGCRLNREKLPLKWGNMSCKSLKDKKLFSLIILKIIMGVSFWETHPLFRR